MKKERAPNRYYRIRVGEEINTISKGECHKPSEVPNVSQDRETPIRNPKPGFTPAVNREDDEPSFRDMHESLTQAIKMIKRWA